MFEGSAIALKRPIENVRNEEVPDGMPVGR
jgi:hypothetical protein